MTVWGRSCVATREMKTRALCYAVMVTKPEYHHPRDPTVHPKTAMRISDIVAYTARYIFPDLPGRSGAAYECFVVCQDCAEAHHRANYRPSVELHPPSETCPLCMVPWAPGTVVPTAQTPIMVFRPPSALGVATEGVPLLGGTLGAPPGAFDRNRKREAGYVFDTVCHACLLADERRRLGDPRYRCSVSTGGDTNACPFCHLPWQL